MEILLIVFRKIVCILLGHIKQKILERDMDLIVLKDVLNRPLIKINKCSRCNKIFWKVEE
jgi:hypothetical protein